MEKKVIVSRRFRKNVSSVYKYLLEEHSAKVAFTFLDKLQNRIDFIIQNAETGKPSQTKPEIRSLLFQPHNRIYYRLLGNKIELLCLICGKRTNLISK